MPGSGATSQFVPSPSSLAKGRSEEPASSAGDASHQSSESPLRSPSDLQGVEGRRLASELEAGSPFVEAGKHASPEKTAQQASPVTRWQPEQLCSPPSYVESFNGKFRDELLNGELFLGLADARWVIDRWRLDYNHRRRHSALGYQTPAAFAANCVLEDSATLHPPEHRTTTDPKLSHSEWYKIWG